VFDELFVLPDSVLGTVFVLPDSVLGTVLAAVGTHSSLILCICGIVLNF